MASQILVNENGIVKLIDFGLACAGNFSRIPKKLIGAGTPVYLAPEALREEAGSLSFKVDVFSFGMVLWEMLARELPWQGHTRKSLARIVTRFSRKDRYVNLSPESLRESLARIVTWISRKDHYVDLSRGSLRESLT